MARQTRSIDPQSAFCEVCAKRVARAAALVSESRDGTIHFCSDRCYRRWRGQRPPDAPSPDVQESAAVGRVRDDRMKRAARRRPQRSG